MSKCHSRYSVFV